MGSPSELARFNALEALLRGKGVHLKTVASQWDVLPARVAEYVTELKARGMKFERRKLGPWKWRYFASGELHK